VRNLGLNLSFWLAAIILPTNSLALGLGEIAVDSFLNQPLKAEIEVISARAGEIDDLLVGLASRDAFTRAGLSRPNNLTELRFTVEKSEDGESAVILVTTKGSVKEPFLNFLVEADWSKGRLLREFTILLDPPFYANTSAPEPAPEPAPETAAVTPQPEIPVPIVDTADTSSPAVTEQQTITEPIALSEDDQDVAEPEASSQDSSATSSSTAGQSTMASDDVVVEKGDTLWRIASGLRGSGHSMNQIMLAIQRANPSAFGDDNINNLKVGAVLRLPDASTFDEVDQQQAYAQVLQQNGLWDDYVARVTGNVAVAGASDGGSTGGDSAGETGELNLVTPGDGDSDAAGLLGEGNDANELRVKLALAEEELDASRVENLELESRIAELEARLSKFEELQKMVEIEDDSLAQLQADQSTETEDEQVVSTEAIIEEQKTADADALLDELLADEAAAETESDTGTSMPEDGAETATTESESDTMTDDSIVPEAEETTEASDDNLVEEATGDTPPVPVIVTEVETPEPSMLDSIIPGDIMPSMGGLVSDPLMLGGLGGILLLIIGLVIYKRKKKANDEDVLVNEPIYVTGDDEEDFTPIHLAEGGFEEDDDGKDATDETEIPLASFMGEENAEEDEDEFSRTAVISADDMPAAEEAPAATAVDEQDDILNEADVYLAYNLYENAEELLKQSIDANPERADYRSKLLDTYFATKSSGAFISEAEKLRSMGKAADRYWDRVMVMGFELAPDNALFAAAKDSNISAADLEIAKPAAADFDLGSNEDDTNFSTTDFDLGEEDTSSFEATDFNSGEIGLDLGLDELPELGDEDDTNIPDQEAAGGDEEEMEDLNFSFDEEDSAASDASSGSMDFELPEDLDLGSDSDDDLDIESTAVVEVGTAVIDTEMLDSSLDDDLDFGLEDDEGDLEATAFMSSSNIDDESFDFDEDLDESSLEATSIVDSLDMPEISEEAGFGMDDTAMMQAVDGEIEDVMFDMGDDDDDDALSVEIDMGANDSKTGTFAPGDFEDPEELSVDEDELESSDFDDIEDLMLPDDVDEVSTKLDLARAFIDMGDAEGARGSLEEVMSEGDDEQKAEAKSLLDQI